MEYFSLIITALSIHLLAVVSPGPDLIMVLKNSLMYSRSAGIYTAIGLGGGMFVHFLYCSFGLALVISQSLLLFSILKYAGAMYLIYVGVQSFRARNMVTTIDTNSHEKIMTRWEAVRSGFFTNVFNPKATLFFLGLFTLVVSPTTPMSVLALLGTMIVVDGVLWFSFVAVMLTQKPVRAVFDKLQSKINKIFGVVLIAFGIKVGLE